MSSIFEAPLTTARGTDLPVILFPFGKETQKSVSLSKIEIYEVRQVDIFGCRDLWIAGIDPTIFSGREKRKRLSPGDQPSRVLLRFRRSCSRMADRILDNLKESDTIQADNDPVGIGEIQLWNSGDYFVYTRSYSGGDFIDGDDRSNIRYAVSVRLHETKGGAVREA
jgi:hypothetical protein